jgi:hypothetical protein
MTIASCWSAASTSAWAGRGHRGAGDRLVQLDQGLLGRAGLLAHPAGRVHAVHQHQRDLEAGGQLDRDLQCAVSAGGSVVPEDDALATGHGAQPFR